MSIGGTGVALKEREQDLRVHVAKQAQRTGPEPLQLGAELVDDPGTRGDEILPRAGQRPQRLRPVGTGRENAEPVTVGGLKRALCTGKPKRALFRRPPTLKG